jgi:hypothetical protein
MSPANSDRCPGRASEKLKREGNEKNEEPYFSIGTSLVSDQRNRRWSMSAPVPLDYAESGDCTEREKDPTQNKVIGNQGDSCAEDRQASEQSKVARLGVHPAPD